ncbi:MAG: sulfurtransferase-like selenium metabolism protein YedF [Firmicutes bacterium]|nr:sulfurtransferase-like selenium metabolism protein YedF [Bacillota bacterium]
MINQVDARGLACPQPVIMTKKALEEIAEGLVVTIVDNEVARDNVIKLAQNLAYGVDVEQRDQDYYIRISKGQTYTTQLLQTEDIVLVITGNTLGKGDDELGAVLMKSLIYTLTESDVLYKTIIFLNSGVKLTCAGSPVLEHLMALEKAGTEILSCGTCLDFFNLKDKLCVGSVTNMYTITEHLTKAQKVINF